MTKEQRKTIAEAVETVRGQLALCADDSAAAIYSQRWVDKRRVLFVEDALDLILTCIADEALDARALAERMESVLNRARELAPGHGMGTAQEAILAALTDGDPTAADEH